VKERDYHCQMASRFRPLVLLNQGSSIFIALFNFLIADLMLPERTATLILSALR
jgi:hypothetical protein